MFFSVGQDYIFDHLAALLASTFGRLPVVHRDFYSMFNIIFIIVAVTTIASPALLMFYPPFLSKQRFLERLDFTSVSSSHCQR